MVSLKLIVRHAIALIIDHIHHLNVIAMIDILMMELIILNANLVIILGDK